MSDCSGAQEESQPPANLGTMGCAAAIVNLILGTGIFTVPYCFSKGGWQQAPIVALVIGIFWWTAYLLGRALDEARGRGYPQPDFGIVGELAFGPKFNGVFTFVCCGECFLMSTFYLLFIAESIKIVWPTSKVLLIVLAAASGVGSSLVPKQYIAVVSAMGVFLTFSCVVALVGCGVSLEHWDTGQSFQGKVGLSVSLHSLSSVAVAVGDHAIFPGVFNIVKTRENFERGTALGFTFVAVSVLIMATVAYITYGDALKEIALANMGRDLGGDPVPGQGWIGSTANLLIAVRTVLALPSFIRPVVAILQDALVGERSQTDCLRFGLLTLAFAACAGAGIVLADHLTEVEDLVSAMFKSLNGIVIPCLCYLRLCKPTKPHLVLAIILISIAGAVWGIGGTVLSVYGIIVSKTESATSTVAPTMWSVAQKVVLLP